MSLIKKMRKQTATAWPALAADKFGQLQFDAPVEIKCRWEDVQEQVLDPATGNIITSKATVYVDRVLPTGSLMVLAALGTLTTDQRGRPREITPRPGEVISMNTLPNLKNNENLLTAYLK